MQESSTNKKKQIFRYTQVGRSKKTRHFRKLEKKLKPESVRLAEVALAKAKSKTVDPSLCLNYVKVRADNQDILLLYYGNETKTIDEPFYPGLCNDFVLKASSKKKKKKEGTRCNLYWGQLFIANYRGVFPVSAQKPDATCKLQDFLTFLNIMMAQKNIRKRVSTETVNQILSVVNDMLQWSFQDHEEESAEKKLKEIKGYANHKLQSLNMLPFRKMKLSRKIYHQQDDARLVENLKLKFGSDAVLIIGDWSAPSVKFHEPIRNKGLIRLLKKHGFLVYMVNEYKTSSVCPEPDCEKEVVRFKSVDNPRPHKREERPTVICNGLSKCDNHKPDKLYNRDMLAVLNFRRILRSLRETGTRPASLTRTSSSPHKGKKRKQDGAKDKTNKKRKTSV